MNSPTIPIDSEGGNDNLLSHSMFNTISLPEFNHYNNKETQAGSNSKGKALNYIQQRVHACNPPVHTIVLSM